MSRYRPLLILVAAALVAPAAASAGTVTYDSTNVLKYTAAAGEVNRLRLTENANRVVFTEETGIPITEGVADCDGNGTPVVTCKIDHVPASPVFSVTNALGNMDDRVTAAFPPGLFMNVTGDGGAGADEMDGSGSLVAQFDGGIGPDRLTGGRLSSDLVGGLDNDVEIGGPAGSTNFFYEESNPNGADQINGGPGVDVVEYDGRANSVNVSADGVADDGEAGEGDNVAPAVEALQGSRGPDVLVASSQVDGALSGYSGADHLVGGPGDDVMFGGDDNDILDGNGGDDTAASDDTNRSTLGGGVTADLGGDTFNGGPGFDTADYSRRTAGVRISLNGVADDGEGGEGDNTGGDVEQLLGGIGGDNLAGDDDAERYEGGPGNDTIAPAGGSDDVSAESGDDTITAQDSLFDRIACGVGTDTVSADFVDVLDGCENATVGAAPNVPAPDTTPPAIALTKLKTKQRFKNFVNGFRFRVGANEPASFTIALQAVAGKATIARSYNLTLATKKLSLSGEVRSVKLKAKRALLGKRKSFRLRLRVTAKDAAGNTTVRNRTIRVRRR